jgi:HJR/Mrr/RecB family endonuclease/DNA-binding transcriptional regulator/RsmH inhibitor MraZ
MAEMGEDQSRRLRGCWITNITRDGCLCVPKNLVEAMRGSSGDFHVTSTTGDHGRLYTMAAWQAIEDKLAQIPSSNIAKQKYLFRTSYYGMSATILGNRLQLSPILLESAQLRREAIIIGTEDHLRFYSLEHLNKMVHRGSLKLEEMESIAEIDSTDSTNDSILAAIDLSHRQELVDLLTTCRKECAAYVARHAESVFEVRPRIFEIIISEVMKSCGFEVELTAQTRDGGVDLIAVHRDAFGISTRYVVECKRWSAERRVSIDLVRALYGAKEIYKADHAIYVTTASFTRDTWSLSRTGQLRNVTLVDFEKLKEWFELYLKSQTS